MSETDEQTIMTDKGSTLIERWIDKNLASPFWRYYITAFIFVHWKIWLYLFSNMPVHEKITEIQKITIFYNIPDNWWIFFIWIADTFLSLIYIVGLPLITSRIVLSILRPFEKETAQSDKRHYKEVKEKINNTTTKSEDIQKLKGEHQETLKLYRQYVNDLADIIDIKDLEFDGIEQIILSILSDIENNPPSYTFSGLFTSAHLAYLPPGGGMVTTEGDTIATKAITYCIKEKYIKWENDSYIVTEEGKKYISEKKLWAVIDN